MNAKIAQLFGLTALLFALLVGYTSRWSVFEAESLEDEPSNRRALIEEQSIPRGLIYARDGRTVLAENRRGGTRRSPIFERNYPQGALFGHPIGYSFIERGRTGLEQERNRELAGEQDEFSSIFRELRSKDREGKDIVTTLDVDGQREATNALSGQKGAIVAIEPQTGRVRVMASSPGYAPGEVKDRFGELSTDRQARPLVNRATQERYPPGSTFKVVTAAAALDSGRFNPDSILDGSSPQTISGRALNNFGGQDFGPVSLTEALTNSVNVVWARVGERVGRRTLVRYMQRFGFYQDPRLDYPDGQMTPSGIRGDQGQLLDGDDGFDVGRVAIGQGGGEGQILVTPIQMAMVAAAIGNKGRLMRPRLTEKVVAKDGRVTDRIRPDVQSRVMSSKAAGQLAQMMGRVVEEGTGTAAALGGISVAGKTGTAEVRNGQATQPWFIAFAPVDDPRMAIAVTLQDQPGNATGGQTAAPLAKRVLQTLIGG